MLPYLIIILVWIADRLSKIWAASFLATNGPTQINSFLTIRETYNRGIAFGLYQGIGPLIGWLTVIVVLGMLIYLWRLPANHNLERIGLALVIGGALGNLVDRVASGQVLDFIETPFRPGIFNVADMAINLGIIVILLAMILAEIRQRSRVAEEVPPTP
jgi:signal peptidase II